LVGKFYKIRHKLPWAVLKTIYFAFVHSHILYGIELYVNTGSTHLHKLLTLYNKLLRILQNKPYHSPTKDLFFDPRDVSAVYVWFSWSQRTWFLYMLFWESSSRTRL